MREIKLRGKHILDGAWVYGTGVTDFLNIYYKKDNRIFIWALDYRWVEIEPKTLSEYTGLKDKNGVEIYEGDIIYHSGLGNSVIEYEDNSFVANVVGTLSLSDSRFGSYNYRDFNSNITSHEVIGNIYDNSDLLKC